MKRFDLGNSQYLELKNGKIMFNCRYENKTLVSWKDIEINKENLLDWVHEALKSRYYVKKTRLDEEHCKCWNYAVKDRELDHVTVAIFGIENQAEKYCSFLNGDYKVV